MSTLVFYLQSIHAYRCNFGLEGVVGARVVQFVLDRGEYFIADDVNSHSNIVLGNMGVPDESVTGGFHWDQRVSTTNVEGSYRRH